MNPPSSGDGDISGPVGTESEPSAGGGVEPLTPAWAGSGFSVPRVPDNVSSNVYMAGALGSCQACDVKPGE